MDEGVPPPGSVLPVANRRGIARYWWGRLNEDRSFQTGVGGFLAVLDIGCALLHAPTAVIVVVAIPGAWILSCAKQGWRIF